MLQVYRQGLIGDLARYVGLPIVLQTARQQLVEQSIDLRIGHAPVGLADHRPETAYHLGDLVVPLACPAPTGDRGHDRLAVPRLGHEGQRQRPREGEDHAQLLRRLCHQPFKVAENLLIDLIEGRPAEDLDQGVKLVLEGGHGAEVAAATADRPKEVRVVLLIAGDEPALRRHHIGRDQVVAGKPVGPGQIPHAAAEGQAGDAGCRHDAPGGGQTEGVRCVIEVAPGASALRPRGALFRVDAQALQRPEVEHETLIAGTEARHAVTATAQGQHQLVLRREADRRHDVGDVRRAHDQGRPPVVHGVVDMARVLVIMVRRADQNAAQARGQPVDILRSEFDHITRVGLDLQ